MWKRYSLVGGALWQLCVGLTKKLSSHVKEVDRARYCKCCGALASYYVTTAFVSMTNEEMAIPVAGVFVGTKANEAPSASLLLKHTPSYFLCNDHHPLIGKSKGDARKLLTHPKHEFHLITPNPYK